MFHGQEAIRNNKMEEENNMLIQNEQVSDDELVQKRLKWAEASRQRRKDPMIRERMREKNLLATRLRRQNPEVREKERERNRLAMRIKRQNPDFREKERLAMSQRLAVQKLNSGTEKRRMAYIFPQDALEVRENERYRHYLSMAAPEQQLKNSQLSFNEMSDMLPLEMEMRVEEEDEDDPDAVGSYREDIDESQEEILPAPVAVTVVPFGERIRIKQEVDLDQSATADEMTFHEEVDIKEEEPIEDKSEGETFHPLSGNLKIEEDNCVQVEATPSASTIGNGDDDSSEDEILPEAAMVVVPGRGDDYPEDFVEENIAIKPVLSSSKRQKTASKRVDTVYRCPNCSLCYTSPEYLAGHVRRGCRYRPTPIKNAYRCITCGEGFSNYGDLYQHKRQKHDSEKKETSETPPKTTPERKTSNSRGLPCPNCPRFFSTPGYLVQHMRAHVRSRTDRTCDVCGEKLDESANGQMEEHFAKKHPDMQLHRCGECGRAYGRRHNLVTHLLSHTGTEEIKCYICNKDFANRSLLSAHLRTHPSTRPFECSVCGKTYLQQGRFYEHRRREHGIVEKPIASPLVMWPNKDTKGADKDVDATDVCAPESKSEEVRGTKRAAEEITENGTDCEVLS